jgi:hypothetical protein
MLYAIRLATSSKPDCYLRPACFDSLGGYLFSSKDMPASSRKFSSDGDAALCCESLPFTCEVVPVAPGHEYPAPAPAGPPASDVPLNGKAH